MRGKNAFAAAPIPVGMLREYQRTRLFCFLDPYADAQGACYQLVQALNALGSGGWQTSFEARKELWFGSIPPADQGAVRVQGGLLSLPETACPRRS